MKINAKKPAYVLITPARNEEVHIEKTIRSVLSQSLLPAKWIIVSDGSTDQTDEIIKTHTVGRDWILLVRLPEQRDRSFAAKVACFNEGLQRVQDMDFEVLGNLDADISFEPDYFEFLMQKFIEIENLGVAGTPFMEDGYSTVTDSFEGEIHVAGGCQLFRRKCFEDIGGYRPVKAGGIDWIAVTTARMKGWKTRAFKDKLFFHHRSLGTAGRSRLASIFSYGQKDYYLGGHPVWEVVKFLYGLKRKPYITGSVALISGYLWGFLTRAPRAVSPELMAFHRREQMRKLGLIFRAILHFKRIDKFNLYPGSE